MPSVKGGALIRNSLRPNFAGTLGCVVASANDPARRYLLTAGHVIARGGYARDGEAIEAFTPDGWKKVAEFERAVKLRDATGVQQTCDTAVARITDPGLVADDIEGLGAPTGSATRSFEGMRLQFFGAASKLVSTAQVQSTDRDVDVIYNSMVDGGTFRLNFKQQTIYGIRNGVVWQTATQGTDSGALILDQDGVAIGLHIARTPKNFEVEASICTPIRTVLNALGVVLPAEAGLQTVASAPPTAATVNAPAAGTPALSGADLVGQLSFDAIGVSLRSLMEPHNSFGGVKWQLTRDGLVVDDSLDRSPGALVTVPRVWRDFGPMIEASARQHRVPVELIIATICTETSGRADAVRTEPGYVSDTATPDKVSPGLMQTLISTARSTTGNRTLTRADLLRPEVSIDAGTAYISEQRMLTRLDPPQVACAYNAGRLVLNDGVANRWKMRQFPIGTGAHADRFTLWFNDCFAFFAQDPARLSGAAPSYFQLLRRG